MFRWTSNLYDKLSDMSDCFGDITLVTFMRQSMSACRPAPRVSFHLNYEFSIIYNWDVEKGLRKHFLCPFVSMLRLAVISHSHSIGHVKCLLYMIVRVSNTPEIICIKYMMTNKNCFSYLISVELLRKDFIIQSTHQQITGSCDSLVPLSLTRRDAMGMHHVTMNMRHKRDIPGLMVFGFPWRLSIPI